MRLFVVLYESVMEENFFLGPRVQMIIIEMEGCVWCRHLSFQLS